MNSNHATQQPVDWILSHKTQNASRANDGTALRPLLRMQVASQSLTWALAQSCISGALKERRHDAAIAWIAETAEPIGRAADPQFDTWFALLSLRILSIREASLVCGMSDAFGSGWMQIGAQYALSQGLLPNQEKELTESVRLAGLALAERDAQALRESLSPAHPEGAGFDASASANRTPSPRSSRL